MTTTNKLKAEDMISRAIIELQKPQPFFAHLLMRLNVIKFDEQMTNALKERREGFEATMAVDARGNMYYEPSWVESLGQEQVLGVLCHEVLHVAFLHLLRMNGRHEELSNIAQDMTVNMMVTRTGLKLPKEGIPYNQSDDTSWIEVNKKKYVVQKVSEKTWEEIYAELLDSLKKDNNIEFKKRMGFDTHIQNDSADGEGNDQLTLTKEERQEIEGKWQTAIAEAAQYAKQQGKLPAGMDRYIDGLLKPAVHWRQMMLKYLRPYMNPTDWSYQRPNRKSQQLEVFLPVVRKEHCEVEIVIDTSGSISNTELSEFLSEVVAISKAHTNVKMWVSFVDAAVQSRKELDNADAKSILSLKPKGGGGTSMEAGLDYIKKANPQVPVVVVFTDAEDSYRSKKSSYPFDVIWVVSKNGISYNEAKKRIPYGTVLKVE